MLVLKKYLLPLVFVVLGVQITFAKDRIEYRNVLLYVARQPEESVVSVSRGEVFRRWDKKIELGLNPTIRLSQLLSRTELSDKKYQPEQLLPWRDYIIIKAVTDKEEGVELFIDVNKDLMSLNGFLFKDDKAYRDALEYVIELAGSKKAEDPAVMVKRLKEQFAKKPAEK